MSITAKGYGGGSVSFDGQFLEINHGGLDTFTQGRSNKRVHVSQITAVSITPANWVTNGIFSVTLAGAIEVHARSGRRGRAAGWDPNSLRFLRKHEADFRAIRDAIETAMVEMRCVR
jgi:hypothetical protein